MENLGKKVLLFIVVLVILMVIGKLVNRFVLPVAKLNSESMQPTFNKGDIIFYTKSDSYGVNDIIIFYSTIKDPIVARIIEINSDGTYKAKGDNPKTNPVPIKSQLLDETQISKTQILGKVFNFSLNPVIFILLVRGIQIILALLLTKLFYYRLFEKKAI